MQQIIEAASEVKHAVERLQSAGFHLWETENYLYVSMTKQVRFSGPLLTDMEYMQKIGKITSISFKSKGITIEKYVGARLLE